MSGRALRHAMQAYPPGASQAIMPWRSKHVTPRRAPLALQCPAASDSCSPAGCIASRHALEKQACHTPPGTISPAMPCGQRFMLARRVHRKLSYPAKASLVEPRRASSAPQCPAVCHYALIAGCVSSRHALRKQVRRTPPGTPQASWPHGRIQQAID